MKKILLSLSALLMGVVLFTSCDDDDTPQLRYNDVRVTQELQGGFLSGRAHSG